jgi:hypothetical protein
MNVPTKRARVIARLLQGRATSFELERECGDHCAPSTISELRREGLDIRSEIVPTAGYGGCLAHVARYELQAGSRDQAIAMMTPKVR